MARGVSGDEQRLSDPRPRRRSLRGPRVLRGAAAATIAVLIASTAHTLSGGDAPPLWLVLAVTILATPVCVALVGSRPGSRRGLPGLASAVAAAQLALHSSFAAFGGNAFATVGGATGAPAHHHAIDLAALVTGAQPAAATMTLGHAVAALATFILLAWGERLVTIIARGIRHLLRLDLPTHRPQPARARVCAHRTAPARPSRFAHTAPRRGPPTDLALALTA